MVWRYFRKKITDDGHLPLDPDIVSMLGPDVCIVRADDGDGYRGKSDDGIPGSRQYLDVRPSARLAGILSRIMGNQEPELDTDPAAKHRAMELLLSTTDSTLDTEGCLLPSEALEHIRTRSGASVDVFALGDHLVVRSPEEYACGGIREY